MRRDARNNFQVIAGRFCIEGIYLETIPYGFGHINDTFLSSFNEQGKKKLYIMQRINSNVFTNPEKLMENIIGITQHLKKKIIQSGGDPLRETLNLIPTKEGKWYHIDKCGDYWRMYMYIDGAQTYEMVKNSDHFYKAGKSFGNFQKMLADYPAETLFETIPDFHNTAKRYETFIKTVEKDPMSRTGQVLPEIEFITSRKDEVSVLTDLLDRGELPLRVTHNDTKFNNIMIDDKTGEGICVVDLDTVMPGLSLYDYGDSIRYGASTAGEDETDLDKVALDMELFELFTKGFLEKTKDSLTDNEIRYFPFSAKLMAYELGMRFLTDHLNGDVYFKIHRDGHNLDRCRTQLKLVWDMEKKMDTMEQLVRKHIGRIV